MFPMHWTLLGGPDQCCAAFRNELTCTPSMPRFWVESVPTGDGHAQEQIYRRADHQGAEGTRGRAVGQRCVPEARHQRCDLEQVAVSVRWDGDLRCAQAEGVGGGELQAQEAAGGDDARWVDAEGEAPKKLLTPSLRRRAVTWAIGEKSYSQRRACALVGLHPKTYRPDR